MGTAISAQMGGGRTPLLKQPLEDTPYYFFKLETFRKNAFLSLRVSCSLASFCLTVEVEQEGRVSPGFGQELELGPWGPPRLRVTVVRWDPGRPASMLPAHPRSSGTPAPPRPTCPGFEGSGRFPGCV